MQLLVNAAWTPVFFGAWEIGWALVVFQMLWLALLLTLLTLLRVSSAAGCVLVPYRKWVSFAAVLSFTLWRMYPE